MKIAVCDDEQRYLNDVGRMLREYGTRNGIKTEISLYSHPFDLMQQTEKGILFDLYLLDIYMPGTGGIELAQELRKAETFAPIVFLTSSKEHALEAFGVGAIRYLVKPFAQEDFLSALSAAVKDLGATRKTSILLRADGTTRSVELRNFLYSESHKNYQHIHLADGDVLEVRLTVGELFSKLCDSSEFARCGSSYILSFSKIKQLRPGFAILTDGTEIPIPRGAYAELKELYFAYYEER